MKTIFLSGFCLFIASASVAQEQKQVPLGSWRMHLPYTSAKCIQETPGHIYCATNNHGFFSFDKSNEELSRLSKIDGFSDVDVEALAYHQSRNTLIIGYANCNIDLVQDGKITNIPDIYRKVIVGDKKLNHIFLYRNDAYISTSFGIVVLNLERLEIRASYLNIDSAASVAHVFSTCVYKDSFLVASTKLGIIMGDLTKVLEDYGNWQKIRYSNVGSRHCASFNGKIIAESDSFLYSYNNGVWSSYITADSAIVTSIRVTNNKLVTSVYAKFIIVEDENGNVQTHTVNMLEDAIVDALGRIWYASIDNGLVIKQPWGDVGIFPNGPKFSQSYTLLGTDNELYMTAGGVDQTNSPVLNYNRYNFFNGTQWFNHPEYPDFQFIHDITVSAYDKKSKRAFLGSHGKGMCLVVGNVIKAIYNETNSPLTKETFANAWTEITGLAFDKNGHLWISNFGADSALRCLTNSGKWYAYKLPFNKIGRIEVDDNNNKWISAQRDGTFGLISFNENGTFAQYNDDRIEVLTTSQSEGNLPSNNVLSMATTADGELWIGTDQGLARIRNTSGNVPFQAERIIVSVETGTNLGGYLLGSQVLYDIHIDGANRRWVATNNGGWLIDSDGETVVHHFTIDNSPLLSDEIRAVTVVDKTGEVFFGTSFGLMSYRGNATSSEGDLQNIRVFPNPVRENFNGTIAINGLKDRTLVKITDINGNLVYETYSNGGTATWNGIALNGNKPATGVYLIFAIDKDGTESGMGKMLFVK